MTRKGIRVQPVEAKAGVRDGDDPIVEQARGCGGSVGEGRVPDRQIDARRAQIEASIVRGDAYVDIGVGALEFDLLLGDVHSLKEKRSLVRPLIAEVRRRFELSVAEVDHLELHRRAGVGVAAVSPDRAHLVDVLDAVERLVAFRPEVELLSVRRTLY